MMALIVCIPFSYAAIESPTASEAELASEEVTDLIINVQKYEPTVLVDSVIRETNAPLYVSLYGVPTTGRGVPRIQSITIRETDTDWLQGGIRYYPQSMYSWDNLGYFETKLKRIDTLAEIPDTIDINLAARIKFEAETTTQLIGAVQTKELIERAKISKEDLLYTENYSIANKGYIVANKIGENDVDFTIYDSEGIKISSFNLDIKEESREYGLISGSRVNEDIVRIRLEKIEKSTEKPSAIFEVGSEEKELREGQELDTNCILSKIKEDYVVIQQKDSRQTENLYLQTSEERLRKDTSYLADFCVQGVLLKQIKTGNKASVTILPGRSRGEVETTFSLHIPVEKSLIGYTNKEIVHQLNVTQELIEDLDDVIERLSRVVERWRKLCLASTAFLVVYKFFVPLPEVTGAVITGAAVGGLIKVESRDGPLFLDRAGTKEAYRKQEANILYDSSGNEAYQNIVYDKNKTPYYYDSTDKLWKVYNGLNAEEAKSVYPTRKDGESVTIVPIKDPENNLVGSEFRKVYNTLKDLYALDKGFYVVYYPNKLEIYQAINDIDLGEKDDRHVKTILENEPGYIDFKNNYIKRISSAQKNGEVNVEVEGNKWSIDTAREFRVPDLSCEQIFCPQVEGTGSCWQCILLYNSCDPVVCPPSRCNLAGKWQAKKSVVESGIIASLIMCAPNIKPSRGAVMVPFCLSGLLAGIKNIRSLADGYRACLLQQLQEGKTFGLCERIQSIYICELVWKEVANLLMLKGGFVGGMLALFTGGGAEYFTASLGERTSNARRVADYFVQSYAKEMYINYLGKSTAEVGTEICKSFVGGKLPKIGDFVDQFAAPDAPTQFTAHFEEQPYSELTSQSRYSVFYHVYAGTLKGKDNINYYVYLKKSGERDLIFARGTLKAEEWATDTVTEIAIAGYEQICVNIDGVPNCNFGKLVSSSAALDTLADKFIEGEATKTVTSKNDCVSESAGYLGAPVERRCEATNPYKGRGEAQERRWTSVGDCGYDENGVYLGKCWMKVESQELMDIARTDACKFEGVKYCNDNENCIGETIYGKDLTCCKGVCETKPAEKKVESEEGPNSKDYDLTTYDGKKQYAIAMQDYLGEGATILADEIGTKHYFVLGEETDERTYNKYVGLSEPNDAQFILTLIKDTNLFKKGEKVYYKKENKKLYYWYNYGWSVSPFATIDEAADEFANGEIELLE